MGRVAERAMNDPYKRRRRPQLGRSRKTAITGPTDEETPERAIKPLKNRRFLTTTPAHELENARCRAETPFSSKSLYKRANPVRAKPQMVYHFRTLKHPFCCRSYAHDEEDGHKTVVQSYDLTD